VNLVHEQIWSAQGSCGRGAKGREKSAIVNRCIYKYFPDFGTICALNLAKEFFASRDKGRKITRRAA
jgi:hypothetical protein